MRAWKRPLPDPSPLPRVSGEWFQELLGASLNSSGCAPPFTDSERALFLKLLAFRVPKGAVEHLTPNATCFSLLAPSAPQKHAPASLTPTTAANLTT